MNKSVILFTNIYNTIQEIEVKGEKNCASILGICNAIKEHLRELQESQVIEETRGVSNESMQQ